ncbi:hypothetical protein [Hymenobacter sp. UYP22]|uniref:hypothetical protein n=1 Tax=Hymenobacter sp. UYP22 TaxID=3156348 RepID=UPI003393458E
MPEKRSGIPTWGYLLAGLLVFALYYGSKRLSGEEVMRFALGKKSEIMLSAMGRSKVSPRIMRRTGKIVSRKFDVGDPGPKEDSITFRLVLKGEKATATIRTRMMKQPSGEWQMVKSDTAFSE